MALREQGYQGELTLIGEEVSGRTNDRRSPRPYSSATPTSRTGSATRQPMPTRTSPCGWGLSRPGSTGIARWWWRGATEYPYDKLLIATGSAPRRLDLPGADLEGLLTLRTLEESLALRDGSPKAPQS